MSGSRAQPWLRWFAFGTALCTFALIGVGGLVTSHEAGMAVPDWPNSYDYNMFLFPISKWMGGILYEHTHRLVASAVGLLTSILAAWLWVRETRGRERWIGLSVLFAVLVLMGVRKLPVYLALASFAPVAIGFSLRQIRLAGAGLRWWGVMAFAAVILQGVLGGLRVVWLKDEIGIFHAALAQLFLVLICLITLFTTDWWSRWAAKPVAHSFINRALLVTTVLIFCQLVLGGTMRHQHAGLAIPDFPLAYGRVWPAMDAQSVLAYNQQRVELTAVNPITSTQIALQMIHRILALLILAAVGFCAWSTRRSLGGRHPASKLAWFWLALVLSQAFLGAATIWSNKAADIATGHVLVGALCLVTGVLLNVIAGRSPALVSVTEPMLPVGARPVGAQSIH